MAGRIKIHRNLAINLHVYFHIAFMKFATFQYQSAERQLAYGSTSEHIGSGDRSIARTTWMATNALRTILPWPSRPKEQLVSSPVDARAVRVS
jgi:hypothetical protein